MRGKACLACLPHIIIRSIAAEGDATPALAGTESAHEIETAPVRQPQITDDQIALMLRRQRQRIGNVACRMHAMTVTLQQLLQNSERRLMIFHDEKRQRL